jgi:hypothetical protein
MVEGSGTETLLFSISAEIGEAPESASMTERRLSELEPVLMASNPTVARIPLPEIPGMEVPTLAAEKGRLVRPVVLSMMAPTAKVSAPSLPRKDPRLIPVRLKTEGS